MNIELARQALEASKAHRDQFNMAYWVVSATQQDGVVTDVAIEKPVKLTGGTFSCGTIGCYAGMVGAMTLPDETIVDPMGGSLYTNETAYRNHERFASIEGWAAKRLEITARQASALFYLDDLEQVEKAIDYLEDNPDACPSSIADAAGNDSMAEDFELAGL